MGNEPEGICLEYLKELAVVCKAGSCCEYQEDLIDALQCKIVALAGNMKQHLKAILSSRPGGNGMHARCAP